MHTHRICLALLLPLLAGCAGVTGLDARHSLGEAELSTRLSARVVLPPEPEPTYTARGVEGGVVVDGHFWTPSPCFEVDGTAVLAARMLTLTVTARQVGEACVTVVATFLYTAEIEGLTAGDYTLRVVHARQPHVDLVYSTRVSVE